MLRLYRYSPLNRNQSGAARCERRPRGDWQRWNSASRTGKAIRPRGSSKIEGRKSMDISLDSAQSLGLDRQRVGFNRSVQFSAAVDLLLKMQEIEALRGGWVVFNDELNPTTAQWYRTEDEAIWSSLGTCRATVPREESRPAAIANLTAGIVYSVEESRHIAGVVPDSRPEYLLAAEAFERHLFGPDCPDAAES
jgi:hypothetical protein